MSDLLWVEDLLIVPEKYSIETDDAAIVINIKLAAILNRERENEREKGRERDRCANVSLFSFS